MRFINTTGNTVSLNDVGISIPFIGDKEQTIDADIVKKSSAFQSFALARNFVITEAGDSRTEQNLIRIQKKLVTMPQTIEGMAKVVFKGHFKSNTGYGKSNINMVFSLARSGVIVSIEPIGKIEAANENEKAKLERLLTIPDDKAILIHSAIPSFAVAPDRKYSVLYTTIESSTIPKQFEDAMGLYNEIWVVSDFCKEVLEKAGVKKPIYVIPNGVDTRIYNELATPLLFKPELKPFRFISVFGWNYRKGYDALLKAYLQEFTGSDPVSLLIVSKYQTNMDGTRKKAIEGEIKDFIAKYGGDNHPQVSRCGVPIREFDMPRIYRACNCFVLPTRGEGLCLPYMESSLCGLPVIATNYSGQTMFLRDDNSYLVDIDRVSTQNKTNVHFWDGQEFPELMSDEFINNLRKKMRYVYENYEEARQKNKILQQEIIANYSAEEVGLKAKKRLEAIKEAL